MLIYMRRCYGHARDTDDAAPLRLLPCFAAAAALPRLRISTRRF